MNIGDYVQVKTYGSYDNQNYGAHTMQITVGDMTIYFSYQTPIAFRAPGVGYVVSENVWSRTTGKHFGMLPGNRSDRVPNEKFNELYLKALSENVYPPKDEIRKAMLRLSAAS